MSHYSTRTCAITLARLMPSSHLRVSSLSWTKSTTWASCSSEQWWRSQTLKRCDRSCKKSFACRMQTRHLSPTRPFPRRSIRQWAARYTRLTRRRWTHFTRILHLITIILVATRVTNMADKASPKMIMKKYEIVFFFKQTNRQSLFSNFVKKTGIVEF